MTIWSTLKEVFTSDSRVHINKPSFEYEETSSVGNLTVGKLTIKDPVTCRFIDVSKYESDPIPTLLVRVSGLNSCFIVQETKEKFMQKMNAKEPVGFQILTDHSYIAWNIVDAAIAGDVNAKGAEDFMHGNFEAHADFKLPVRAP